MRKKILGIYYNRKFERNIFICIIIFGILSSTLLYSYLSDLPFQFGKKAIGVFIPPFLTVLYMFLVGFRNGFTTKLLLKSILLFLIQILPFLPLLFKVIQPNTGEDFARYLVYARNMLENHTLWGGDKLAFPKQGYSYITQPGYRYFIALELLLFKDLYRFVSFVNISLFIIAIFYLIKTINEQQLKKTSKLILAILVLLTIPYSVKNILMGLTEWFAVILMIISAYLYISKRNVLIAVFILAFVPFIRQNLLPSVFLLFLLIVLVNKNKLKLAICFIIPLLLPLYHNIYYAGEWRFFVSIFKWPFLTYSKNNLIPVGINFKLIINNLVHYAGFNIASNRLDFLEEAVGFLVFYIFVYGYLIKNELKGINRYSFLLITLSTIVPSIFLATDFYPRFEYINVYVTIITFLFLIKINKEKVTIFDDAKKPQVNY